MPRSQPRVSASTPAGTIDHFEDLLINERLGRTMRDQLSAVYRAFTSAPGFHDDSDWQGDPAFFFYMAVYEELWRLPPGDLMGPVAQSFGQRYPDYRTDAQLLAQNLFHLGPNLYTQFLYFMSAMLRYVGARAPTIVVVSVYRCERGEPSAGDWADALVRREVPVPATQTAFAGRSGGTDHHRGMAHHAATARRPAGRERAPEAGQGGRVRGPRCVLLATACEAPLACLHARRSARRS